MRSVDWIDRFNRGLVRDLGLDPARPLVVGFSGGTDSLCLLGLLAEAGWQVIAAHFDHGLRPESGQDAERAAGLAAGLGVGFVLGAGNVSAWSAEKKIPVESAAREMRYAFLFETARRHDSQAVCTAHTSDDQAETVLMHLLRGSGLAGLRGMLPLSSPTEWDRAIPLARPLLGVSRAQTEAWCRERGLAPVEDASNADTAYTRNRIRHELLPLLEGYNPNLRATLARTAEVLRGEEEVVAMAVEGAWMRNRKGSGPGWVGLDLAGLRRLGEGLLRGVLRRAARELLPGLLDLDYEDVQRAAAFVRRPARSGEADLACGLWMRSEVGQLYLETAGQPVKTADWPQLDGLDPLDLSIPVELGLSQGWILRGEWKRREELPGRPESDSEAWLDGSALGDRLQVRPSREGERIQPWGMDGKSQKLSDLWINARVPRRARARYPLVCSGERVLWVPGVRRSLHYPPGEGLVLVLTLIRPSSLPPADAA